MGCTSGEYIQDGRTRLQCLEGDPPSFRRSHEIYSTFDGVPSVTRRGNPTSRKMIASIQRSGRLRVRNAESLASVQIK